MLLASIGLTLLVALTTAAIWYGGAPWSYAQVGLCATALLALTVIVTMARMLLRARKESRELKRSLMVRSEVTRP